MGSYAAVPELDRSEEPNDSTTKLGDALSGRFADVDIDSVRAVREQREP
ncbi:hypothetical protein [Halovenus halobia]